MRFLKTFLIYILVQTAFGCSNPIEKEPPETVLDALNVFIGSAPFQYINLDDKDTQSITISENNIIYSIVDDESSSIGSLSEFTKIDDRFYIYDSIGNAIFKIEMDGTISKPLTREGSGPGEHRLIFNLNSNSRNIYATDSGNGRTNLYTTEMDFAEHQTNLFFSDVNDELILLGNQLSRGIAPENPEQGLMVVRSLDTADTLATLMPRIIPAGHEPQMHNTVLVSLNQTNAIAAAYYFLPWFFLFDDEFNHIHSLILEYPVFDEMDIPPLDFFKDLPAQGFGGSRPVTEFKLMDNGDLFLSIRRELFHLSQAYDGTYEVAGKYQFYHPYEEEPLWISDIFSSQKENKFYVGSTDFLFRFDLNH